MSSTQSFKETLNSPFKPLNRHINCATVKIYLWSLSAFDRWSVEWAGTEWEEPRKGHVLEKWFEHWSHKGRDGNGFDEGTRNRERQKTKKYKERLWKLKSRRWDNTLNPTAACWLIISKQASNRYNAWLMEKHYILTLKSTDNSIITI